MFLGWDFAAGCVGAALLTSVVLCEGMVWPAQEGSGEQTLGVNCSPQLPPAWQRRREPFFPCNATCGSRSAQLYPQICSFLSAGSQGSEALSFATSIDSVGAQNCFSEPLLGVLASGASCTPLQPQMCWIQWIFRSEHKAEHCENMILICLGSMLQQPSPGAAADPHWESVQLCVLGKMQNAPSSSLCALKWPLGIHCCCVNISHLGDSSSICWGKQVSVKELPEILFFFFS